VHPMYAQCASTIVMDAEGHTRPVSRLRTQATLLFSTPPPDFCAPGPAGTFSSDSIACQDCAAGRYGGTTGLATSSCSGQCSAGYACPAGSTSATASRCPPGQYSLASAEICTACPAGTFGEFTIRLVNLGGLGFLVPVPVGLTTAQCTGPCDAGRYGATGGQNASSCSGPCSTGFACPPGSTYPTVIMCPAGQYSMAGSGVCTACPSGQYSARGSAACVDSATLRFVTVVCAVQLRALLSTNLKVHVMSICV
jgi:hypothetical protein